MPASSKLSESERRRRIDKRNFAARAKHIAGEVKRAPRDAATSEYERAPQVLKRHVYSYIRLLERDGLLDELRDHVRARVDGKVPFDADNPFLLGLRLIEPLVGDDLPKGQRSKFAAQLRYAHQHDVTTALLTPFLASVGSYELIKSKLDAGESEDWAKAFRRRAIKAVSSKKQKTG